MRALMLATLLPCAGTSASYGQGNSDTDAESKIVAMEHVWAQAYMVKDPRALARILDDAFVCVSSEGRLMTKAGVLENVKTSTALQIMTESMVVRLHGDMAVVAGTFRTRGVEHGKPYARRELLHRGWQASN